MKAIYKHLLTVISITVIGLLNISTAQAKDPLPIDNWAIRDAVSTVSVSPDGKHVLILKMESKEGNYVLEIYKTDDFSKPLRRLNADPMELISANWASDNYIVGRAWQVVRKMVRGPEEGVREQQFFSYNLERNKFSQFTNKKVAGEGSGFSIESYLPKEPNSILVSVGSVVASGSGVDPFAAFRPKKYFKLNLKAGRKTLVYKGNTAKPEAFFDIDGNPRISTGYNRGTHESIFYYRKPGEKKWNEFARYDQDDPKNIYRVIGGIESFVGIKHDDPNIGYMIDSRGEDKASLWEFDFRTGEFGKKLFSAPDADVTGIQTHSMFWAGNDSLVAARYPGAKRERHWFDMKEKALYEQFESKIPNGHQISITSRSRDGKTMVVFNNGPRDPGSYWFVQDGKMAKLASRNPLVKAEDLSDVEYIRYKARDGKVIPAYVTKPKGTGPFPLIVLPHGGPHVNEVIGYDEWGQFLANNGYMVLQPQYRMSTGWGADHFNSAMGQHGLAMQDDKDDGAQYLIDKGWVEKDRVAMFGWSYGGYAALVAASRSPNMYQCTIAGAAVADPKKVYLKRSKNGKGPKILDAWSRARGGYVGINPIKELDKVNIPVMMIHGDWDARVLYFNFKDYKKEMVKSLKERSVGSCTGGLEDSQCTTTLYRTSTKGDGDVPMVTPANGTMIVTPIGTKTAYTAKSRFVTLKGADHFYSTLMYGHQKDLYTKMLDFLQNDCGPGGL